MKQEQVIAKMREFNRFYSLSQGFLHQHYLHSPFSLSETRILYELYEQGTCNPRLLVTSLGLDKGQVSHILTGFEKKDLIHKEKSQTDRRMTDISLRPKGKKQVEELSKKANLDVADTIAHLTDQEKSDLFSAMDLIMHLLTEKENDDSKEN